MDQTQQTKLNLVKANVGNIASNQEKSRQFALFLENYNMTHKNLKMVTRNNPNPDLLRTGSTTNFETVPNENPNTT